MFIYFPRGAGGTSTDPGESNVVDGVTYTINGTSHTGTFTNDFPTVDQIALAVWGEPMAAYTDATEFGGFVRKLLTVVKFLGLK